MAVAIIATLMRPHVANWALIAGGIAVGSAIGVASARLVRMTQMSQMVAIFNGVGVGGGRRGADRLGGVPQLRGLRPRGHLRRDLQYVSGDHRQRLLLGPTIAFGKLQGLIKGRPVNLGVLQTPVNLILAATAVAGGTAIVAGAGEETLMVAVLATAGPLATALVLPIGGADMPVVISLLNACTGLSAAATGVALNTTALIVAGMLVGASGTLLTQMMAAAMNRSVRAIIAGGFGATEATSPGATAPERNPRSTTAADVAIQLAYAHQVVIAPGYGLAVSQAQHASPRRCSRGSTRSAGSRRSMRSCSGWTTRRPCSKRAAACRAGAASPATTATGYVPTTR